MTKNTITLTVQARQIFGKKSKNLRDKGFVVGNIIHQGKQSDPFQIPEIEFNAVFKKVGETSLFYVKMEGKEKATPVLIEEIQRHPILRTISHVVLKEVSLKEKIEVAVPLVMLGEVAVREAVLVTVQDELTIKALPTNLPEKIEVDVAALTEVGQQITAADLKLPDGVEVALEEDQQANDIVIAILQAVKEEVEEETPTETVESPTNAEVDAAKEAAQSEADGEKKAE